MIGRLLLAISTLALAGCADALPTAELPSHAAAGKAPAPGGVTTAATTQWSIFTTQTPASTLDASPGWEVGTRFYIASKGCVIGLRFWRGVGETGTNTMRLWKEGASPVQLAAAAVPGSGSGWQYVYLGGPVCLDVNQWYRVSVNTNTKQVKTFGTFDSGPVVNGPLHATSGYYGQPMGSMPTTASGSNFFADVVLDTSIIY
jgi:hypothetical protein